MYTAEDPPSAAVNLQSHQEASSSCLAVDSARPVAISAQNLGTLQKASHLTWSESASTARFMTAHLSPRGAHVEVIHTPFHKVMCTCPYIA